MLHTPISISHHFFMSFFFHSANVLCKGSWQREWASADIKIPRTQVVVIVT